MRTNFMVFGGGLALAAAGAIALPGLGLFAADHVDPPTRTDPAVDQVPDRAADIADLYVWHTADRVNFALTFGGPSATTQAAFYDPNVLYTINVSNAPPRTAANYTMTVRFGPGSSPGEFGVKIEGIPGTTPIIGSVESNLTQGDVMVRAGLFDDPFFFDSQGLRETRSTGTIRFNSSRDFFSAQNITGVVISAPRSSFENGSNVLDVWSTSARFGGQL